MAKRRSKHEYVFGYVGDHQCVYGQRIINTLPDYIDKMTLFQAQRRLGILTADAPKTIFKLVPVDLDGKEIK